MIIHPIISNNPFEPTFNTSDFYERAGDPEPPPIKTENDENPEYVIERLIGKRLIKNRLKYFVK